MLPHEIEAMHYHALVLRHGAHAPHLHRLYERSRSWEKAYRSECGLFRGSEPETAWRALGRQGLALIMQDDTRYPALLAAIPQAPRGIYVRGTLPRTPALPIAIVGTRKATATGIAFTKELAEGLARAGATIVSGLAIGIDAAGHVGCLAGGGTTIAVLGSGIDQVHPECHEWLARKILEKGGAIVSEYPPGAVSYPSNFLARNRIVSGLSRGVAVVEVPDRSGALVTARLALEQGRDVFAVPGPAAHPNFMGSHRLIREGAELVISAEEVLMAYGIVPHSPIAKAAPRADDSPDTRAVLTALRGATAPLHIDKIAELTNLKVQRAAEIAITLTLERRAHEADGGYTI